MAAGEGLRRDEIGRSDSVADPRLAAAVEEAFLGPLDSELEAASPRPISGRAEEFAGFYIRYRFTLVRHAQRYLHDRGDVEEVVQETFLKLFLALPDLEDEIQAIKFCRRVLTNLCIDRYRERSRRPALVGLEDDDDCSEDDSEFDAVVAAEDAAVVRQALALLSPLQRAALVKREVEEKPLPEIAAELGIPAENVKYVLYRARQALRKILVGNASSFGGAKSGGGSKIATPGHLGVVVVLIVIAMAVFPRSVPNGAVTDGHSGPAAPTATPAGTSSSHRSSSIDAGRSRSTGHSPSSAKSHSTGSHSTGSGGSQSGSSGQPGSGSQQGHGGQGGHNGGGHTGGGHTGGGHNGGGHNGGPHSRFQAKVVLRTSSPAVKVTGRAKLISSAPRSGGVGVTHLSGSVKIPTNVGTFGLSDDIYTSASGSGGQARLTPYLDTSSGVQWIPTGGGTAQVLWLLNGHVKVIASAQITTPGTSPQPQQIQVVIVYSSWSMTRILKETIEAPLAAPSTNVSGSNARSVSQAHSSSADSVSCGAVHLPVAETREVVRSDAV